MTTLISYETSGGKKGRCDAQCHNAAGKKCACCCGGRYHGAGRDGTLGQKVEALQETLLNELQETGATVIAQLPLPLKETVSV